MRVSDKKTSIIFFHSVLIDAVDFYSQCLKWENCEKSVHGFMRKRMDMYTLSDLTDR